MEVLGQGPTTGQDQPENESMATASKCCREKYWGELTSDEKIERLRLYVRKLPGTIERQATEIRHLREQFVLHAHTGDKVVMPITLYGNPEPIGLLGRMRHQSDTECYI